MSLFVSLTFYWFRGSPYTEAIVYFPDSNGNLGYPEVQFLPKTPHVENGIRLLVDEVLLGPIDLLALPILHDSTRISNIFYQEKTRSLVLSFTKEAMNIQEGVLTRVRTEEDISQAFSYLTHNLRANFPFLKNITFLIDGQIPFVPPYTIVME